MDRGILLADTDKRLQTSVFIKTTRVPVVSYLMKMKLHFQCCDIVHLRKDRDKGDNRVELRLLWRPYFHNRTCLWEEAHFEGSCYILPSV